jgi:release factor glutamine methyltransferase
MTTIREALNQATLQLDSLSASARLDAEILLGHTLKLSRAALLAESQRPLSADQIIMYRSLVTRRVALEPVAYITGHKEFYGLDFVVDRRVLVPRPETELLVALALSWCSRQKLSFLSIADIGTGSGCIAVSLAVHLPEAQVYGVDLSIDALEVARINCERHNVANRITLLHGAGCAVLPRSVDLLVSNPPYTVLAEVDENVHRWEPHLALDGGEDSGFAIPARLLAEMPTYLQPGGAALMEIGAWQGVWAVTAAQTAFPEARVTLHQDLAGLDRVVMIET